jgi:hypothetical protein
LWLENWDSMSLIRRLRGGRWPRVSSYSGHPTLTFERGQIKLSYADWKEQQVQLMFRDVIAFSWDEGDAASSVEHRDDLSYTVAGSEWLQRHLAVGVIESVEEYRHYKLCFNAAGVLQVLATALGRAVQWHQAKIKVH